MRRSEFSLRCEPSGGAPSPGPSNLAVAPRVMLYCAPSKQRHSRMRQLKISKQITNRESQSLDKYLQEIGKVSLVSIDEEVDLAQRIREGDQMALEKLTKANLRFVVSVSKQY
jgi:DNA-directed RNA polymerase sigma subunit (sigma70/sigma32)